MIEILNLEANEEPPEMGHDVPWLIIEANHDGSFPGFGWARRGSGETLYYISWPEDETSLELATAAAIRWAKTYHLRRIWVKTEPKEAIRR